MREQALTPGGMRRHPVLAALSFLAIFSLVNLLAGGLALAWSGSLLVSVIFSETVLCLIALLIVHALGWWRCLGFTSPVSVNNLTLYALPAMVAFLSFAEEIRVTDPAAIALFALLALLVGVSEEIFFRGLVIRALLPIGTRRAVVIAAFCFGLPHLAYLWGGFWDPVFTLVNAFAAIGTGFAFGAILVRTGAIWPLIACHALIDFTALLTEGGLAIGQKPPFLLLLSASAGALLLLQGLLLLQRGEQYHPAWRA